MLLVLVAAWLLTGSARAEAIEESELCKTHWTIGEDWLTYCRNERLGEVRDGITQAVVVVHGKERNAKSYYDTVSRLAAEEGHESDTLVMALQFLTKADVRAHGLGPQYLTWSTDGWKHGLKSQNGANLSSFTVLDKMLARLIAQNPKLTRITIAGHSAGGQFVQRHAVGCALDLTNWNGELHHVVTNAGSYMFLTPDRPHEPQGCTSTYNNYRYGPADNRLDYFLGTSPDGLWRKLVSGRVSILLGNQDTETAGIDRSCPARAQGANRFERGKNFHRLTLKHLPPHLSAADLAKFQLHIIPNVGHEFGRMWDSRCGRQLLFGRGTCTTAPPPRAAFPL